MSRRATPLPQSRDGATQRGRALAALDPSHARIDERTDADLIAFVREFATHLANFAAVGDDVRDAGTWQAFADHPDLSVAEIAAYIDDPDRFSGDAARWLGRPHFALFLAFVALFRHARDQLNGLTARHLDYYYRDILRMRPLPAEPDRVAVVVRLANRVPEMLLPAGTALAAGRDSAGVARVYRTERDLLVNRARVTDLRSVFVDRRITGIPDVRRDASLTAAGAFDRTLQVALGQPSSGDDVPAWEGHPIDRDFFVGLRPLVDFARGSLYLEHHELRALLQRVRRQESADAEWAEINRLLGVVDPKDPRDFLANLESRVGPLDFRQDGLPEVEDVDDLYEHRADPDVRAYIDSRLSAVGYDNFVALMPIKLRIDSEWAEIGRLLERAGRRQRGLLAWNLDPSDPMDFQANLEKALEGRWPPPWPDGTTSIFEYDARLRALEEHLHLSVERAERLVAFAESLGGSADAGLSAAGDELDWIPVDHILSDAHAEQAYAARRAALAEVRGPDDDLAGFDRVVTHVLNGGRLDPILPWETARPLLARVLDVGQLGVLDGFRDQKTRAGAARILDWPDVYRVLELAQRYVEGTPTPVARTVEWRNLYAWEDATASLPDPTSARWRTFGGRPAEDPASPPAPNVGFAVRSPILALSEGKRAITLTLGFAAETWDRGTLLRALGVDPALLTPERLVQTLARAFVVEVTTAKGWKEVTISAAALADGKPGDDWWSIRGADRTLDEDRAALQLRVVVDAAHPAIEAPPAGLGEEGVPTLRLLLRPSWDKAARQWTTPFAAFERLSVAAAHVGVTVDGLAKVRLQQDDRPLDPKKPWEPFGGRPAPGARLYVSHPELVRNRLDALRLDLAWMGLPADLADSYANYPGVASAESFTAKLALIDRGLVSELADTPLFDSGAGAAKSTRTIAVSDVPGTLARSNPGFTYARRVDLAVGPDLRDDGRFLRVELGPVDFGHAAYPALASKKAREQAVALSKGQIADADAADAYRVDPPYTPTVQSLSVAYATSIEIDPDAPDVDLLVHVHPFGETLLGGDDRGLLPRYDRAGELYVGLADVDFSSAPLRRVSLLLQLAEGTSDPDAPTPEIAWTALDGDTWKELVVLHDSTRGLVNSGIVELELPAATPGGRLPGAGGTYWIRVSIARDIRSVCDTVAIRCQAVTARFEDRGNAPDHYAQPLPAGSVQRLLAPDARIAAIEQPFTSTGGRLAEAPDRFHTRVSERLRHRARALAPWDYERLVLQRFSQIYQARCLPSEGGGEVDVIVVPDIRDALPADASAPRAPADLLADIQAYLAERAPAAATVRVRNPRYVPVLVRIGVRFLAGVDEAFAKQELREDLVRFLSPWAYDEGAELTLGGRIYAASIVDFVDRRDYVDYVAEIELFRGNGHGDFALVPTTDDYCVATDGPDEVLVASRDHVIDVIPELGYDQGSFTGIDFMSIELDFIVGA